MMEIKQDVLGINASHIGSDAFPSRGGSSEKGDLCLNSPAIWGSGR